ncbi:hypothetical protein CPB84DRAFT_1340665 [Gymnopilus junonius]|uniref:Uncharacterized protein n=1 Tax=Gymnopilus junonius TaxID=109634 RepID=A0A9P5NHM4_GYMJU|nr:hypothetical protein CPB84DRAFT_1340665 [Gymnopilus junonius]
MAVTGNRLKQSSCRRRKFVLHIDVIWEYKVSRINLRRHLYKNSNHYLRRIMSQDWRGANVTSGAGGTGAGSRGGDIGSRNRWDSSTRDSNNDSSIHKRIKGNNYEGPVDQGDKFNGPISNSAVGGRGNSNAITNQGNSQQDALRPTSQEAEIDRRLAQMRERLTAKKERERLRQKEEELKRLEAELGDDE